MTHELLPKPLASLSTLAGLCAIVATGAVLLLQNIVTPAGSVTVLEDRPFFFGKEGVRQEVLTPGRSFEWATTLGTTYYTVPITLNQEFIDLPTKDTALLDFNTSIQVQIKDARALHERFTAKWADNNLHAPFSSMFRDITKQYTMTDILTSSVIAAQMEQELLKRLNEKMVAEHIPVVITDFNLGQGRPNDEVVEQMNKTLAQQQAKKTYEEMDAAQKARKMSESSRAAADKAYADAIGYSPAQLIQMDFNQRFSEACAKSTCIIQAGATATPMAMAMPARN